MRQQGLRNECIYSIQFLSIILVRYTVCDYLYELSPIAYISFFCILTKCPRYKSGPYLTQSVYFYSQLTLPALSNLMEDCSFMLELYIKFIYYISSLKFRSLVITGILWCSTPLWYLALQLVENIASLQFHHGVLTPKKDRLQMQPYYNDYKVTFTETLRQVIDVYIIITNNQNQQNYAILQIT